MFVPRASSSDYDAFNPTARRIYWQQISRELFADGIDGWWLDASEPELSGTGANSGISRPRRAGDSKCLTPIP